MPLHSWRDAIAAYASPAALALLLLGFAAGLPYMLVFSTLSVWLREAGVSHATIGYASLIGLAYAFKWVWSPLLDQWRLPLLGRLGRRRSWLVMAQLGVIGGLLGMSLCDPSQHLSWLIAVAVLVAFASATQDIAVDAYRLEIADESLQATLAASYMAGYRVATVLATAGALYFVTWFDAIESQYNFRAWANTYVLFAALMLPGFITTLWMREPDVPAVVQQLAARYGLGRQLLSVALLVALLTSGSAMLAALYTAAYSQALLYAVIPVVCITPWGRGLLAPVLTPISDFIRRYRWQAVLMLALIATYRMSDTVMGVMANVFYLDQGFSKDQIASISKLFGLLMTLAGAATGGLLIVRFGIMPILFIGAAASAATNLLFALLASMGADMSMLVLTISCDNFSAGLATAAFVAFLSSLTNLQFSATQYALLSSIMLLLPRLMGGYSGALVEQLGYQQFFVATALLGIPTLLLVALQWRRGG